MHHSSDTETSSCMEGQFTAGTDWNLSDIRGRCHSFSLNFVSRLFAVLMSLTQISRPQSIEYRTHKKTVDWPPLVFYPLFILLTFFKMKIKPISRKLSSGMSLPTRIPMTGAQSSLCCCGLAASGSLIRISWRSALFKRFKMSRFDPSQLPMPSRWENCGSGLLG